MFEPIRSQVNPRKLVCKIDPKRLLLQIKVGDTLELVDLAAFGLRYDPLPQPDPEPEQPTS